MGSVDLQHEFCLKTSLYIDNNFVSRRLCQTEFPYQGSGSDLTLGLSERIRIPDSGSISVVAAMDPLDESIAETQTAHVIDSLLGQPCAARPRQSTYILSRSQTSVPLSPGWRGSSMLWQEFKKSFITFFP